MELSAKSQKILDSISELSVLELSELVKGIEEKFDVKAVAAAPVVALVLLLPLVVKLLLPKKRVSLTSSSLLLVLTKSPLSRLFVNSNQN